MSTFPYPNNFLLDSIPQRTTKERDHGITMVMDKGLSLEQVHNFCECAPFVDFVKFGFGTSFITPFLKEKIAIYQKANIHVFLGGTLFESFLIRNQLDLYVDLLQELSLKYVEISDGMIKMNLKEKISHIENLRKKGFIVLSEVGRKKRGFQMFPFVWVDHIRAEINAGAEFVVTESRESGNVGIYRLSEKARNPLINKIMHNLPVNKIVFEAPKKDQQLFFINKIGCNVNLGNIAPSEIIALEAMRIGLRGDTFYNYLPK